MPKPLLDEVRDWLILQKTLGKKRVFYTAQTQEIVSLISPVQNSSWENLRETVLACTRCPLSKSRTHVVFGEGNEKAKLVFVGEGPGFEEDRQGRPFVGKAGQLLNKMIEAMGLKREDVYIANIVKCRPPENRMPQSEEIEACSSYLTHQLEKISPQVICALGNVAAQTLLQTEKTISRLRGLFHEVNGVKIMPTFHPAFLLRNPEYKREVWRDLQLIMEELKQAPITKLQKQNNNQ